VEQKLPEGNMQTAVKDRTPLLFGPFVLERRIAVGGSAEVFLARPRQGLKPAPQLVIKRLSRTRGKSHDFDALSREAELHRAVRHANVVTVFGAGMVGDEPYLAMEYVPGVDLHRLLRLAASDNRTLSSEVAAYIARSIADALFAVHSARDLRGRPLDITHGDVSPSNIYLSLSGEVKLGDFGVARAARGPDGTRNPQSGEVLKGKVGYLAPEQLKGAPIDQRCDIFALGVVLGEMLIGEKVFSGSGQLATMLSNREANIEPLRRVSDQLPAPLYRACMRALEPEPERRCSDARAFADSLGAPADTAAAKAALADWVSWARDDNLFAQRLERRLRHSSGIGWASPTGAASDAAEHAASSVRRAGVVTHAEVTFPTLLQLAMAGHLGLQDEVSLLGAPYRRIDAIPELSRYVMPSTANTTSQLFGPGVPDYTAALRDTPMLDVLARLRNRRESGALFVARARSEGSEERKDIYVDKGRLVHVAASDREELLGQYMLRLKLVSRADLDLALAQLKSYDGHLGEALVGLGLSEPSVVSRAARNFGRDRVAALCGWREGHVQLYRGSVPSNVEWPLDLDLSVVMMLAAMQALGRGHVLRATTILPGRRFEDAYAAEERGSAPSSLIDLLEIVGKGPASLADVSLALIERGKARERVVSKREAHAALMVAIALDWLRSKREPTR
jgi:eukaryotic-like serine/threonine-protein kinase